MEKIEKWERISFEAACCLSDLCHACKRIYAMAWLENYSLSLDMWITD